MPVGCATRPLEIAGDDRENRLRVAITDHRDSARWSKPSEQRFVSGLAANTIPPPRTRATETRAKTIGRFG
jgi:hypothetical protein